MLPNSLLIEDKLVPLIVRENSKARRLTLRFRPETGGEIVLTIPRYHSKRQIIAFIEKSKPWLKKQVAKSITQTSYMEGMVLPIFGQPYVLRHKPSKSFRSWWGDDHLLIHSPIEKFGSAVQRSLHQVAKKFLTERSTVYATQLEKSVNRVTLRDTRSRWGSCTVDGNLSYSWRLIFAPELVADYVCAHEVAHLVEMNHSSQFWEIVQNFCPNYKQHRNWLRQNGKTLFQYGI